MHYISGKHLPRRTFLQSASASVALPLLDGMIPAGRSWRDPAEDPHQTRLICVEEADGLGMSPVDMTRGGQRAFFKAEGPGARRYHGFLFLLYGGT